MAPISAEVVIRPARAADIPSLVGLLALLFTLEADFEVDADCQRRGLDMLIAHPLSRIMVAEGDGRVVGMCSGQLTISTAEGGYALLLEDLVVDDDSRGRGVGRRLLDAVAGWAAGYGAVRMQLLADRGNDRALDFYHHLGWRSTGLFCLRRYHHDESGPAPGPPSS
jgi:GNAT superfamily N-acetyltransferase